MFNDLLPVVQTINACLSDYILVFLLMGVGLFYSIRTRFVQIRCFGEGLRRVFGNFSINGKAKEGQMSSFQALATAIAAQVGTGNIVGACGAILTGGPGAIFWMWIIAFFGMATIYAEAVLAQVTRVKQPNGTYHGGPVYYIHKAFPGTLGRVLAVFFAVAITLARLADVVLVAPATANVIAKCACGMADDMLTTTLLATKAPVFFAPAMNTNMYENSITQQNLHTLQERGCHIIDPAAGYLACGTSGVGRMPEPQELVEILADFFATGKELAESDEVDSLQHLAEELDFSGLNKIGRAHV